MISREPSSKVEYWTVAKQLGWDHASSQYLGDSRTISLTPSILPLLHPSLPPSIHSSLIPLFLLPLHSRSHPPLLHLFPVLSPYFISLSIRPSIPPTSFPSFDSFIHAIDSEILLYLLFICFSTTGTEHTTCYIAPWAVRTIIHSSS